MNRATQGMLCIVGLLALAALWRSNLQAQDPSFQRSVVPASGPNPLVTLVAESTTGQQVTVIDSSTRVMAVYQIEKNTGRVTLKSVRQIHWDLELDEFNGVSPTPREIQSLLSR